MKSTYIILGIGLIGIYLLKKRKDSLPPSNAPVVLSPTIVNMTQDQLAAWITAHMYAPRTQEQQEQYDAAVDYYNENGTSQGSPGAITLNLPTFTLPL